MSPALRRYLWGLACDKGYCSIYSTYEQDEQAIDRILCELTGRTS